MDKKVKTWNSFLMEQKLSKKSLKGHYLVKSLKNQPKINKGLSFYRNLNKKSYRDSQFVVDL